MKHEPIPAIHMEKHLGGACKLGGAGSLGISKAGETVLASFMESQIWHQPASSGWRGFRKGIMASAGLDARHLGFSLHTTGAFPAATRWVLELRGSESE